MNGIGARTMIGTRPSRSDLLVWVAAVAAIAPAIAVLVWATPVTWRPHRPAPEAILWFVLIAPVLEEIVFRGGLQEWLLRHDGRALGPLSRANLLASLVFAGCHLAVHPPAWAAAVFLPSLVLGRVYERGRRLAAPIVLHALYNACFFGLLAIPD